MKNSTVMCRSFCETWLNVKCFGFFSQKHLDHSKIESNKNSEHTISDVIVEEAAAANIFIKSE